MQNQIITDFKEIQSGLNGNASTSYNLKRIEALSSFEKLGFPTTKHEEWKYSNVKKLVGGEYEFHKSSTVTASDIDSFNIPDLKGIIICFVNGVFSETLSDIPLVNEKLSVLTFKEAQSKSPEFLNSYFDKISNSKEEAFTAMNTAIANDGVVIELKDNTVIDQPIILRMIGDVRDENSAAVVRNLIHVGENSEVKIAESFRTLGSKSGFVNSVTEILIEKDARVDYYKVQDDNNASYHIGSTNVYQKDKSYFYAATITVNGGFVRNNLNLVLDGEHIESFMYGLYVPNENQHIDNHTVADHKKPNSVSNELYKGVLMDKSTGVFNGKIFVRQEAQKTNAYQNCRNVVTSDSATMNTKPQLEIWADDVKCSHGATTGMLDDEAIFYMQSRGIPKQEAIKMQLLAFAEDVVSQIKIDSIRVYLSELISAKLV